jgi:phosphoribosylaminoimidazolecarboxamide formyltransferase/IMP cyclohydrolase
MKALISVFNKNKVIEFARNLNKLGIEIIATEGTAKEISMSGVPVVRVSELTGFQEMLGGKIKTLHPTIHAEIMTSEIEIVAVNLIPLDLSQNSLKSMDVGGVAMLKSGIKNFKDVGVIVNPERYDDILKELAEGGISDRTKLELAIEASDYILEYESKVNEILRRRRHDRLNSKWKRRDGEDNRCSESGIIFG